MDACMRVCTFPVCPQCPCVPQLLAGQYQTPFHVADNPVETMRRVLNMEVGGGGNAGRMGGKWRGMPGTWGHHIGGTWGCARIASLPLPC